MLDQVHKAVHHIMEAQSALSLSLVVSPLVPIKQYVCFKSICHILNGSPACTVPLGNRPY